MRPRMENSTHEEETAVRCLAHGIAHARDAFGEQRLANILGTIAIDLSELTDTQLVPRASATSEDWLPTSV